MNIETDIIKCDRTSCDISDIYVEIFKTNI